MTTEEPEWLRTVVEAGRQLRAGGNTPAIGAQVLRMARREVPLPPAPRPGATSTAAPVRGASVGFARFQEAVAALPPELLIRYNDLEAHGPGAWRRDEELAAALRARLTPADPGR